MSNIFFLTILLFLFIEHSCLFSMIFQNRAFMKAIHSVNNYQSWTEFKRLVSKQIYKFILYFILQIVTSSLMTLGVIIHKIHLGEIMIFSVITLVKFIPLIYISILQQRISCIPYAYQLKKERHHILNCWRLNKFPDW